MKPEIPKHAMGVWRLSIVKKDRLLRWCHDEGLGVIEKETKDPMVYTKGRVELRVVHAPVYPARDRGSSMTSDRAEARRYRVDGILVIG